jgi:hypothetical protein
LKFGVDPLLRRSSPANADAVTAAKAAVSTTALLIIQKRVLVKGLLLLSKCRMVLPPLQRQI